MAHIFNERANLLARISVYGSLVAVGFVLWSVPFIGRSGWVTGEGYAPTQPVEFRHDLHAGTLEIDCRFCHRSVERSAVAGIPDTSTCMLCHEKVMPTSDKLIPVRESFEQELPLRWARVYDLPDFVRFDHSVHVAKGVGCVECHGPVDQMQIIRQNTPLTMEFCLDCHRDPDPHLRPKDRVFDMAWQPPTTGQAEMTYRLNKEYAVVGRDDCSACHQ